MTREHKLAMIVGFALVLVVGVLVSDHLSGARKARMASVDVTGQEMFANDVDVAFGRKPEAPKVMLASNQSRDIREPEPGITREVPMDDPASAERPLDDRMAYADPSSPVDPQRARDGGLLGFGETTPPAAMSTEQVAANRQFTMGQPVPGSQIPVIGGTSESADQTLIAEASKRGVNLQTVDETKLRPIGRTRSIKEGDTLWSIAEDVYGDGNLHKKLAEYNKSRLGSGGTLRVGGSILIPDKDVLLGKAVATASPATESRNPMSVKNDTTKPSGKGTYVVKKGDTLGAISKRELGTSKRWEEILELNSSTLDDENSLQEGMTLKLPH